MMGLRTLCILSFAICFVAHFVLVFSSGVIFPIRSDPCMTGRRRTKRRQRTQTPKATKKKQLPGSNQKGLQQYGMGNEYIYF